MPQVRSRFAGAWLVFLGGAIGALLRYLLSSSSADGFDWSIFLINISGAFLLALLVGYITGTGRPSRHQLRLRLFLGTGMMGGFTTYSTLAVDLAQQLREGSWGLALAYSLGTVLIGGLLSVAGLLIGRRVAQVSSLPRYSRRVK